MLVKLDAFLLREARAAIKQSRWYSTAPGILRPRLKVKLISADWTVSVDDHPILAILADATLGEETRQFRALLSVIRNFELQE
jgi:hypothetical protein